jgi:uncharacterized protein YPO0396
MKLLNKMFIRNWHHITKETVPFAMLNYLAGKTGTGKTTFIDALQFVLIGDKRGHYFNKAANDKADRSLKGYLFEQTGFDESTSNYVFKREGKSFSTYLIAEFHNTDKDTYFCIGAVFDCYKDMDYDMKYIVFEDRLPDHEFVKNGKLMNLDMLKSYFQQSYSNQNWDMVDSPERYQQLMKKMFGPIKSNFTELLRKAVPFSPNMNIKKFITEFVCGTQDTIDIEHLRDNIRHYKTLQRQMIQINKQIEQLETIETQYQQYIGFLKQENLEQYIIDRSELGKITEEIERTLQKVKDNEAALVIQEEQLKQSELRLTKVKGELNTLIEANASIDSVWQRLKQQKEIAELNLKKSVSAKNNIERTVGIQLKKWSTTCEEIKDHQMDKDFVINLEETLHSFVLNYEQNPDAFSHDDIVALNNAMKAFLHGLRSEIAEYNHRIKQVELEFQNLQNKIEALKSQRKEYPDPNVIVLKETIIEKLQQKHGQLIEVNVFCEQIEIKNPLWRDAIEGYLNNQKFHLIIEPKYFKEALNIYDQHKNELKLYNIGLVDVNRVITSNPQAKSGSLAEEIKSEDKYARAYADFLLGRVMKANHVNEFDKFDRAITPGCMLYQGFVARQLHPKTYQTPYIGRNSEAMRIAQYEEEAEQHKSEVKRLGTIVGVYNSWAGRDSWSTAEISSLFGTDDEPGYLYDAQKLQEHSDSLEKAEQEIDKFDKTDLLNYHAQKETLESEIEKLEKNNKVSLIDITNLESTGENLKQKLIESQEAESNAKNDLQSKHAEDTRIQGESEYQERVREMKSSHKTLVAYTNQINDTRSNKEKAFDKVVSLRDQYGKDNKGSSLNYITKLNDEWVQELTRLKESALPNYAEKIEQTKRRTQEQFQEDFINKLRSKIEEVSEEIDELNHSIANSSFGRHKYVFDVRPNPQYMEFYKMIMDDLLVQGYTLFSYEFMEKHSEAVDTLFKQILDTGEDYSAEHLKKLEENLAKFTDYKTYLEFDLTEYSDGDSSLLSRVLSTKSGGETQTPFYIAVLASFLQTYRVNSSMHNNTPRLVIFDEGFSKMDHQHIKESLKLIRNMGLQLIISAPTDKIADIAPLVDRNLITVRVNEQTVIKTFDPAEFVDGE